MLLSSLGVWRLPVFAYALVASDFEIFVLEYLNHIQTFLKIDLSHSRIGKDQFLPELLNNHPMLLGFQLLHSVEGFWLR